MSTEIWRESRPALDNTHHVSTLETTAVPLYQHKFLNVLPFHSPGYAPAKDNSGSFHINQYGEPIYPKRFLRTFGYYEGVAAVLDKNMMSYHVDSNGNSIYDDKSKKFQWCGNFQDGRCVVCYSTSKGGKNEYFHINKLGEFIFGGPYEYAGDYREGSAVVREVITGLCHHVDLDGKKIYSVSGFYDLDVFHKGFARARDGGGWFHIDKKGNDISLGARYSEIEPFYNGRAYAKRHDGERVVIDEDYNIVTDVNISNFERQANLHSKCVAYWPSYALKLGLEVGLSDLPIDMLQKKLSKPSYDALIAAWIELGLLTTVDKDEFKLSKLGRMLRSGLPDRDRADFWLGPQMKPWLEASQRICNPPSHDAGNSFFETLDRETVDLTQRVLYSYAQSDWKDVVGAIDFTNVTNVVDIGGGFGFLAETIKKTHPNIECVVVEKTDVVASYRKYSEKEKSIDNSISFVSGNLFGGDYPTGEIYILSRILHDWSDEDAMKILLQLRKIPDISRLIIIERQKTQHLTHGMLHLNMLLVNGGRERTAEEFQDIFQKSGWGVKSLKSVPPSFIVMEVSKIL